MGEVVRHIVKHDGLFGMYKGFQSPLVGMIGMNAVLFTSYGTAKKMLGETMAAPLIGWQFFQAGFMAGIAMSFVEGPVDFLKCQLQMRGQFFFSFTFIFLMSH